MTDTSYYTPALAERNGNHAPIAVFPGSSANLPAVPESRERPPDAHINSGINSPAALELLPQHLRELRNSGLSDETIRSAGIYSESNHERLASLLNCRRWNRNNGPGLVYPFLDAADASVLLRVKPDNAPSLGGRRAKYLSPRGSEVRLYVPPAARPVLTDVSQPLCITEGEKKALSATQHGYPCVGLTGVDCWHRAKSSMLIPDLESIPWSGRTVYIVFDSDAVDNPNVRLNESLLGAQLQNRGAIVKIVRLPPRENGKFGLDDFIVCRGPGAIRPLLDSAESPPPPDPAQIRVAAKDADAAQEAENYLTGLTFGWGNTSSLMLRHWRGRFLRYQDGFYGELKDAEVRASLIPHLNQRLHHLARSHTDNVLDQLKALCHLDSTIQPPAWLDEEGIWPPCGIVATPSCLLNLPELLAGGEHAILPPSPAFFTTSALDYDVNPEAPEPKLWLDFLNQLWPDDLQSIETLQDWFGYLLTPDTSLQKIFMMIGPPRSGKGTIARVLTRLLGTHNVVSPPLASFASQFGLAPLLGKRLAIVNDARLSGRTDQAAIVERLLSISGEDALTVDRKNLEHVTQKFDSRLMLISNELPWLNEASGALARRMILLNLRKSFYGKEDRRLTDRLLGELPGIFMWAVRGWARLQQRQHFVQPPSSRGLVRVLHELTSPVRQFVQERCELSKIGFTPYAWLFAEWQAWCEQNGKRNPGTSSLFLRDMLAAFPQLRRARPRATDAPRLRGLRGISLSRPQASCCPSSVQGRSIIVPATVHP